jgi:hypothetical protein
MPLLPHLEVFNKMDYVMLREPGDRSIWGGVAPHHSSPFEESILSPDMIGAEGLRMKCYTFC